MRAPAPDARTDTSPTTPVVGLAEQQAHVVGKGDLVDRVQLVLEQRLVARAELLLGLLDADELVRDGLLALQGVVDDLLGLELGVAQDRIGLDAGLVDDLLGRALRRSSVAFSDARSAGSCERVRRRPRVAR